MIPDKLLGETLARWNDRAKIRQRNERMIAQKRYFDIDNPDRVQSFLTRRGFSKADTAEVMKTSAGFPQLT